MTINYYFDRTYLARGIVSKNSQSQGEAKEITVFAYLNSTIRTLKCLIGPVLNVKLNFESFKGFYNTGFGGWNEIHLPP